MDHSVVESVKMRFSLYIAVSAFFLSLCVMRSPVCAGGFVCQEDRDWAKQILLQEASLKTNTGKRTVAVLYFHNKSGWQKLDGIQKGLALMLITDLAKVKEIQLVERVRMQALVEEMGLGVAGIASRDASFRIGRLLGANLLVGGDIIKGVRKPFMMDSEVVIVLTTKPLGKAAAHGNLLDDFFKMEKDLVFEIIKLLKIELTSQLKKALREPLTDNLDALMYWFRSVEEGDLQHFDKAEEYWEKAKEADPALPFKLMKRYPEWFDNNPLIFSPKGTGNRGSTCAATRNKLLRKTLKIRRW